MGQYVYRIASPEHVVKAKLGNEIVDVGMIVFAYKPYNGFKSQGQNAKLHNSLVTLPCRTWKDKKMPQYCALGHKGDDGVFRFGDLGNVVRWQDGRNWIVDEPDWMGKHVGRFKLIVGRPLDSGEAFVIERRGTINRRSATFDVKNEKRERDRRSSSSTTT